MEKFYVILILLCILTISLFCLLMYLDTKISYAGKEICTNLVSDNGLFIRFPYYIWQINKAKYIRQTYSEHITVGNKTYSVIATFPEQEHLPNTENLIPFLHKDLVFQVELFRSQESPSIINNTQIIGNNNNVTINQNLENNIINYIDQLLSVELDTNDKQMLELFKYKLKANEVSTNDAGNIVNVLSKYVPYISLATSLINIVKAAFF